MAKAINPNFVFENIVKTIDEVDESNFKSYLRNSNCGIPVNPLTNKRYTGQNELYLSVLLFFKFYKSPYFATFKQIKKGGGNVKKGSKGISLLYYNFIIKNKVTKEKISLETYNNFSDEERKKYIVHRFVNVFKVFNFDDVENVKINQEAEKLKVRDIVDVENYISKTKAVIEYKNTPDAFYSIDKDSITLPFKKMFVSTGAFYSTLFHELIHWTGNSNRLDRLEKEQIFTYRKNYDFEELIAETGNIILCMKFGINEEFYNSCIYLKHYLKSFKNESKIKKLEEAFKLSSKAVSFLDNITKI